MKQTAAPSKEAKIKKTPVTVREVKAAAGSDFDSRGRKPEESLFHPEIDTSAVMRMIKDREASAQKLKHEKLEQLQRLEDNLKGLNMDSAAEHLRRIHDEILRVNDYITSLNNDAVRFEEPGQVIQVPEKGLFRGLVKFLKRIVRKMCHFMVQDQTEYNHRTNQRLQAVTECQQQIVYLFEEMLLLSVNQWTLRDSVLSLIMIEKAREDTSESV